MCGIYGVFLTQQFIHSPTGELALQAGQKVLDGLKRLEYRGYDSWGVAVIQDHQLIIDKHVGKIGSVEKPAVPPASIAIGHTRWATHGGVTDLNAHPHISTDRSFAVVQNGVMENYQEVKSELLQKGYQFITQTDTEVIVRLIEEVVKQSSTPISFQVVSDAFRQLAGRNTVAVLTTAGEVYAIRDGSPLVIGKDEHGNFFLSSDVLSIAADATEYYALENREGVFISSSGELQLQEIDTHHHKRIEFQPIDVKAMQLDKGNFDHFMLKEIYEQAEVLVKPLSQQSGLFDQLLTQLRSARCVYTLGAGSADFVSSQVAYYLRQAGLFAIPLKPYEAQSFRSLFHSGDVCIVVSQSGETADTIEVVEWMKDQGVTIASIVNMSGSTLSRISDLAFMLQIGPEIGIASTKAVSSTMTWGLVVSQLLKGRSLSELQLQVQEYQNTLNDWLTEEQQTGRIKQLAHQLVQQHHAFVLGRGQLYMPALESALKLKEISYLHAEGFSAGELKHGVIALIEKGTPVICLCADDDEKANMLSAAAEVKARGARVIGVAAEHNALFDEWIPVPYDQQFAVISSFIPAQLLTYYMAVEKGLDPDKPRNLAKSVTVK